MKIALCLYGKFTGTNDRNEICGFDIPFQYFKSNVITNDTDIFIHGWDDNPDESKKLIELIKPKRYLIEKQKVFNNPYADYNFVSDGPWNTKKGIENNYSRFYSQKQSIDLVDQDYDLVIISRFDTIFYEKINYDLLTPEHFYVSNWNLLHEGWGYNDAWFISNYENIKNFSQIYDRLDDYYKLDGDFLKFIKTYGMDERNITSGHLTVKYRVNELNLNDKVYSYGLEYETWGLLRRLNQRVNHWGRPSFDIRIPTKV